MTAVDTNVLVDVLGAEDIRQQSALDVLVRSAATGALVAAPIVYAEMRAHRRGTHDEVTAFFEALRVRIDWALSRDVWVAAGDAYAEYAVRRRASGSGEPRRLLADFVIGAHALRTAGALATRDAAFYRRAFPELRFVEPAGVSESG